MISTTQTLHHWKWLKALKNFWHPDKQEETAYNLANGEELKARNPEGVQIPSRASREALKKDTAVKLLFQFKDPGAIPEKIWVRIVSKQKNGYVGVLDSEPNTTRIVRFGELVKFGPEHIIQIQKKLHH